MSAPLRSMSVRAFGRAIATLGMILFSLCAAAATKYQPGTIVEVRPHQGESPSSTDERKQYDVSVKIGNAIYVVLYTPESGSNSVEYSSGLELLFLVGKNTITFPNRFGENLELPILQTKQLPPQPAIDWSKAAGQYFSMKMNNLSTSLNLSEDQKAKIKPIAEQESAEAGHVCFTPVVPPKERLKQWEKIVRSSDEKMKPILSEAQWQKLQQMRTEQRQELRDLAAAKEAQNQN